jgi:ferrous iron transport protein B
VLGPNDGDLRLVAFFGPFWALLIYSLNILVVAGSKKSLHDHARARPASFWRFRLSPAEVSGRVEQTWLRLREFIVVAWPVLIAGSVLLSLAEHYHWDTDQPLCSVHHAA